MLFLFDATAHLSPRGLGRKVFLVLKVDLLTKKKDSRLFSFSTMDWQIISSGYTQQYISAYIAYIHSIQQLYTAYIYHHQVIHSNALPATQRPHPPADRFSLTVIVALGTDPSAQKHMVKTKFRIFCCYNQNKMHAFCFSLLARKWIQYRGDQPYIKGQAITVHLLPKKTSLSKK